MLTCFFGANSIANPTNITVSSSSWGQVGIGNTAGGVYDELSYGGNDIVLDLVPGQAVTTQVGQVTFAAGDTGSGSCGLTPTGAIVTNITANGVSGAINLPWTVTVCSPNNYLDTIVVDISDTITLHLLGAILTLPFPVGVTHLRFVEVVLSLDQYMEPSC